MSDDMTRGEELKAAFEAGRAAFAADLREQGKVVVDRKLVNVASEMAQSFWQEGHPGEACLRSGWIRVDTVKEWQATAEKAASDV